MPDPNQNDHFEEQLEEAVLGAVMAEEEEKDEQKVQEVDEGQVKTS